MASCVSWRFELHESVARVAALRGQIHSTQTTSAICRAQGELGEEDLRYHAKVERTLISY